MGKPCVYTAAKSYLVVYNAIFVLVGIVILGLGLWLRLDSTMAVYLRLAHSPPYGQMIDTVSSLLIGLGASIALLSFLGCCGACCESICMLCLYICVLFLILLTELIGVVLIIIFQAKIAHSMKLLLQNQIRHHYNRTENTTHDVTIGWDTLQVNLNCCGAIGPQDYRNSHWYNRSQFQPYYSNHIQGNFVPPTCCILTNDNPLMPEPMTEHECQMDALLYPGEIYRSRATRTRGCFNIIQHWFKKNHIVFICAASIIASLQMLGLMLSCCLLARIRREQYKFPWYEEVQPHDGMANNFHQITPPTPPANNEEC